MPYNKDDMLRRSNDYYYVTVNNEYVYAEKRCDEFTVKIVKEETESSTIINLDAAVKLAKTINIMFGISVDEIRVYHVKKESGALGDIQEIDIRSLI